MCGKYGMCVVSVVCVGVGVRSVCGCECGVCGVVSVACVVWCVCVGGCLWVCVGVCVVSVFCVWVCVW